MPLTPEQTQHRLEKLTSILEVGKALAGSRDLNVVLALITQAACDVALADRCTIFILDRDRNELWSKLAQGEQSIIRVAVGTGLAGTVAQTGEAIRIEDAYADPRFHRTVDQATGYHTQTVLCVPMRDAEGHIAGVLQALNKQDGPFTEEDVELLQVLGGQASGAIENALLHDEINLLFEGFVSAAVVAIESRDPTTAGHSNRVASLTLELARSVEQISTGRYSGLAFSREELRELRYASLLHDFGKVGVRERVLVKANKLYAHELDAVRDRFELARRDRQLQSARRLIEALRRGEARDEEEAARLKLELTELDRAMEVVLLSNQPSVLARSGFENLEVSSRIRFLDSLEQPRPLLTPAEVQRLSIPRGSLSEEERAEVESHVAHTFRFLSQIPWTRQLRRVPEIAYAHHERANGGGYPRHLAAESIPVQSRMMAISDVYDALTASDRPYKKAVPHVQALDILHAEVKAGVLDAELLRVFIEGEISRRALNPA